MSWRDLLGASSNLNPYPHNAHNPQNPHADSNSAHSANIALRNPELNQALAKACEGCRITPAELHKALALEDIENWEQGDISPETLAAFAQAIDTRRLMEAGIRPGHYEQRTLCARCGPVWLWKGAPARVDGCPWCLVRARGGVELKQFGIDPAFARELIAAYEESKHLQVDTK